MVAIVGVWLLVPPAGHAADSAPAAAAETKTLYTCGMHPQVIQDKPGNCPICGMKLTPIRKQPTAAGAGGPGRAQDQVLQVHHDARAKSARRRARTAWAWTWCRSMKTSRRRESSAITIDPVTMQNMGIRTGVGHARPVAPRHPHGGRD